MVIVELFDYMPIENIISILAHTPERIIFVGEQKRMKQKKAIICRFLATVSNNVTKLEYRSIKIHDLNEIVDVLEGIVQDYPNCSFDLTGGSDLAMVATGIVYERHRDQGIELHQYNIQTGKKYDCDLDGETLVGKIPQLTVEQNIILHGGCIVSSDQKGNGTFNWNWTEDFKNDIQIMWEICKRNPNTWNYQINILNEIRKLLNHSHNELQMSINTSELNSYFKKRNISPNLDKLLGDLEKYKIIFRLESENNSFRFAFKNRQIKHCLSKAGTILELKTYLVAREITKADGDFLYNDVQTGVFIDWDGIVHKQNEVVVDTENEIDLILMRGLVPVFISCKNGAVGEEELYKLNTVANRFGGIYAKKVLIATTLDKSEKRMQYFQQRAEDMRIHIIKGVHKMTDDVFAKALRANT